MNITYNKFLITFALIVILGGFYAYFSNGSNVLADAPVSVNSSLASSSAVPRSTNGVLGGNDQIAQDTSFLATLTSLSRINIDTTLYTDPAFIALNDNTVVLDPVVSGRPNPFAQVDAHATITNAQISEVTTDAPSGITAKSAELNGSTTSTTGVSQTYFEYGPTKDLGKSTATTKESLIGSFVTTINGLTSNTTYFYRADAKIGGALYYGDIVSFTTN